MENVQNIYKISTYVYIMEDVYIYLKKKKEDTNTCTRKHTQIYVYLDNFQFI